MLVIRQREPEPLHSNNRHQMGQHLVHMYFRLALQTHKLGRLLSCDDSVSLLWRGWRPLIPDGQHRAEGGAAGEGVLWQDLARRALPQ